MAERSVVLGKTDQEIAGVAGVVRKGYMSWVVESSEEFGQLVAAVQVSSRAAEEETWKCLRRQKECWFCHSQQASASSRWIYR